MVSMRRCGFHTLIALVLGGAILAYPALAHDYSFKKQKLSYPTVSQFPAIAAGPQGHINVSYDQNIHGVGHEIMFTRSIDGGRTFTTPVNISNTLPNSSLFPSFATMATDRNGTTTVVWEDSSLFSQGLGWTLFYVRSIEALPDGALTFDSARPIPNGSKALDPSAAVDSTGRIHLVWYSYRSTGEILYAYGDPLPGSAELVFSQPITLAFQLNGQPSVYVDDRDRAHVTWFGNSAIHYTWTDDGSVFAPTIGIPTTFEAWGPFVATDSGENVYIVWTERSVNPGDILLVRSTDRGGTFGAPINITKGYGQFYYGTATGQMIQVDRRDVVHVVYVWADPAGPWYTLYQHSEDGGLTWSDAKTVDTGLGGPTMALLPGKRVGVAYMGPLDSVWFAAGSSPPLWR